MVPLQGYIPTLISTGADPERRDWLRWASESANTPMFVRMVAEAALLACTPDYVLLRPLLVELKRQHPEPSPSLAAPDDPELSDWLCWASRGGNVPFFVRALVEAALCACGREYEMLRPVLLDLKGRYQPRKTADDCASLRHD